MARDADSSVFTDKAAYFGENERNRVGRKSDVIAEIEILNGLDQSDASCLKEVFALDMIIARKPTHEAVDQAQIGVDETLLSLQIALLSLGQEATYLRV